MKKPYKSQPSVISSQVILQNSVQWCQCTSDFSVAKVSSRFIAVNCCRSDCHDSLKHSFYSYWASLLMTAAWQGWSHSGWLDICAFHLSGTHVASGLFLPLIPWYLCGHAFAAPWYRHLFPLQSLGFHLHSKIWNQSSAQADVCPQLWTSGQVTICFVSDEIIQGNDDFDLCWSLTSFLDLCINTEGYTRS